VPYYWEEEGLRHFNGVVWFRMSSLRAFLKGIIVSEKTEA
jgi:hypothetical protein